MNHEMEKIFVKDILEGQEIESEFLIADLRLSQTKNGKPYVALKLQDCTGKIEGRVWENAEDFHRRFKTGLVVGVRAAADSFQNQVQLKILKAWPVDEGVYNPADFLVSSAHDPDGMLRDLLDIVAGMADPHLRGLLEDILADPEIGPYFKLAPAAKRFHHAYVSGLLEHTLGLVRAVTVICPLYPVLNRDLMIAGAVLHDLGKIREFDRGLLGDYTDEGRLLGHLIIGLEMVDHKIRSRPDFPPTTAMLLKHLIISHHGEYATGSPKRPKILEGLVLHLLDDLDAKMNGIGGFISDHASEETGWTDYNRLMERFFYRPARPEVFETETVDAPVFVPASPAGDVAGPEAADGDDDPGRQNADVDWDVLAEAGAAEPEIFPEPPPVQSDPVEAFDRSEADSETGFGAEPLAEVAAEETFDAPPEPEILSAPEEETEAEFTPEPEAAPVAEATGEPAGTEPDAPEPRKEEESDPERGRSQLSLLGD